MQTPYKLTITNCARYLKENPAMTEKGLHNEECVTAFDMSTVLSIAFCMSKEDVIADLINAVQQESY